VQAAHTAVNITSTVAAVVVAPVLQKEIRPYLITYMQQTWVANVDRSEMQCCQMMFSENLKPVQDISGFPENEL
jgi:hypothetical protein